MLDIYVFLYVMLEISLAHFNICGEEQRPNPLSPDWWI
jgi:hypothetical protein